MECTVLLLCVALRCVGLRGGLAEGGAARRLGGARRAGDGQEDGGGKGRRAAHEPAQVRQGGRYGGAHVPERGLRPAQPLAALLLGPHLRAPSALLLYLSAPRTASASSASPLAQAQEAAHR